MAVKNRLSRWIMVAALCGSAAPLRAAFERQPESVRSCGMGGAGVAFPANVWGGLTNPAGLAGMAERVIALSTAPSPYGLTELRRTVCAYAEPFGPVTASVTALRFGYELYREVLLGAACGVDFGKGLRAGAGVTLNSLSIAGYGHGACFGFDAGVIWEIVPGLQLGAAAANVNAPSPGNTGESIPRTFQTGFSYSPLKGLVVACDVVEDTRFPAELRLGAECVLAEFLTLRGGISTDPSVCSAGIGIRFTPVEIGYAVSAHQELGITHRFGISLSLGGVWSVAVFHLVCTILLTSQVQDTSARATMFDERFPVELTGELTDDPDGSALMEALDWIRMHPYDLNSVSMRELLSVPCVTLSGATAVLAFREAGGKFRSPEELMSIEGGNLQLYQALAPFVCVARGNGRGSDGHRFSIRVRAIGSSPRDTSTLEIGRAHVW
jgi:hypothetical protein